MIDDEDFEQRLKAKMLKHMEVTWDDIETDNQSLGFSDFSLESYRQELLVEFKSNKDKHQRMPKGIYSGFKYLKKKHHDHGIIALLRYTSKSTKSSMKENADFHLIYIDKDGNQMFMNQKEVLDFVAEHKEKSRHVPRKIDTGNKDAIDNLVNTMKCWLKNQASEEISLEDGTTKMVAGAETKGVLAALKSGDSTALKRVNSNVTVDEKYQPDNFDLIAWLLVS
jgi:hypothetical protein